MPGAERLMESLSRVPDGIQPAHLNAVLRDTHIQANIVKPGFFCCLSTTESGLRQIQAGKMFPPGTQSADRDYGCEGRACMLFASIKRRSGVTKGQANREAFVQSTSYEQKLLRVDPAGQGICILLSSEETASRVALVSEPNRVDGFGSVVLLLNLLSPPEPLSGRGSNPVPSFLVFFVLFFCVFLLPSRIIPSRRQTRQVTAVVVAPREDTTEVSFRLA